MLRKNFFKKRLIESVLLFLALVVALTIYPLTKNNANLANDQDIASNSNILYFPTINPGKDWQTTVGITNSECKCNQSKVNARLTAYGKDGLSLGVIKNVIRLRANKTKTFHPQTLPTNAESLRVESNGNLTCNAIFETRDGKKSEVIPAIKESSKQLDFPSLLSYDDLYIYKTITLLNPNTNPASVDIVALNKDGYEIDHTTLPALSSMESKTFSLVDVFDPSILKDLSTVRVNSDSNITGLQLVDYPGVDLVGLPALTTTSKGWTFPVITKGENLALWTQVGIFNPGENTASIKVEAFDINGNSLGIIDSRRLFSGVTYFFSIVDEMGGIIPNNTVSLKITADRPVCGYEVAGVVNGKGLAAAFGIPEENQTTVDIKITGTKDGDILNAYSMVKMGDGRLKSPKRSFVNKKWKDVIISHMTIDKTQTSNVRKITTSSISLDSEYSLPKPPFPVIFIHGLLGSDESWNEFKDFLESKGWSFGGVPTYKRSTKQVTSINSGDFYTLRFSNNQNLHFYQQGFELASIIKKVLNANAGVNKVILIGHSMGGLAAREYLQGLARFKENSSRISYSKDVAQLITIGTPHSGAELATLGDALWSKLKTMIKILYGIRININSAGVQDLNPDSEAFDSTSSTGLNNLKDNPIPTDIQYVSIIGTGATVVGTSQDGDGIVTAFSQDLSNLANTSGLTHQSTPIFISSCLRILYPNGCSIPDILPDDLCSITHICETSDYGVLLKILKQISLLTTNTTPTPSPTPSTTITPLPTPTPTTTTKPTPSPHATPSPTPKIAPSPTSAITPTPVSFKLAFPLLNRDAYDVKIISVFDHSMDNPGCPDNVVWACTNEKGTKKDEDEPPVSTSSGGSCPGEKLYSYKKSDEKPFIINGNYVGTEKTRASTLNYDGHTGYDFKTTDQNSTEECVDRVNNDTGERIPDGKCDSDGEKGFIDVLAAADGVAEVPGNSAYNTINIDHKNGYQTRYLHLYKRKVKRNCSAYFHSLPLRVSKNRQFAAK